MGCGSSNQAAIQPENTTLLDNEQNNSEKPTKKLPINSSSQSAKSSPRQKPQKETTSTLSNDQNNDNSNHEVSIKTTNHQQEEQRFPSSSISSSSSSSGLKVPPHHRPTLSHTEDRFTILKILGEGASCKVVSCRDRRSGHHYAMKIMDKSESYNGILFENESTILKLLKHPNILSYVDCYEDKHTYHLLTVLCQGGELFDRVKNGSFSESVASQLVKQMLLALNYCHKSNIVHRDLKPENFVFASKDEESEMKLIDFGCAKLVNDDDIVNDVAGSPYYCSPEILNDNIIRTGKIWKAADMWSVGVIIFLLVCGFPPFNGDSQEKIFKKIKKGKFRFPRPAELDGVQLSDSVQHLINSLLQMQPADRLTAQQALDHPWIAGITAPSTPLPSVVVDALNSFRAQCRLKKAAARVLLNKMTDDDRANLKSVFSRFDQNGDGQLGPEEVTKLMHAIGKTDTDAKAMLDALDDDGDGGVSFTEFEQAAALGQLQTTDALKKSFDMFDLDHDGFITHMEIERICGFLTKDNVISMVKEVDADEDGKITFEEWLTAMTGRSNLQQQQKQRREKKRELSLKDKNGANTTQDGSNNISNNDEGNPSVLAKVLEEEKEEELPDRPPVIITAVA